MKKNKKIIQPVSGTKVPRFAGPSTFARLPELRDVETCDVAIVVFGAVNINLDYTNCMEATKHSYISKAGAGHISSQCEAFIKEKIMVK